MQERLYCDTWIETFLHILFSAEITEDDCALNREHAPAQNSVVQDIDGDMRGVDIDEIERFEFLAQVQQCLIAAHLQDSESIRVSTL